MWLILTMVPCDKLILLHNLQFTLNHYLLKRQINVLGCVHNNTARDISVNMGSAICAPCSDEHLAIDSALERPEFQGIAPHFTYVTGGSTGQIYSSHTQFQILKHINRKPRIVIMFPIHFIILNIISSFPQRSIVTKWKKRFRLKR